MMMNMMIYDDEYDDDEYDDDEYDDEEALHCDCKFSNFQLLCSSIIRLSMIVVCEIM
jgi:hypothetical protein